MGDSGIQAAIGRLVGALRGAGVPVQIGEHADAVRALALVDLLDPGQVRTALAAALIKSRANRALFDTLFTVQWEMAGAVGADDDAPLAALADGGLQARFVDALRTDAAMDALADEAVRRWSGFVPGRPVSGVFYVTKTLTRLEVPRLVAEAEAGRPAGAAIGPAWAALGTRRAVQRDEALLREAVETAVRRRLVQDRGGEALLGVLKPRLLDDADLSRLTSEELRELESQAAPLARAISIDSRHRRRHPGRLDAARTFRSAVSAGGIVLDPHFRPRRPPRRRVIVLADVSGSVATYAAFALQLLRSMTGRLVRVRSFAFIDGLQEITDDVRASRSLEDVLGRVDAALSTVWVDGHSDYGHAFTEFWQHEGRRLSSTDRVLILGDARNNFHAPEAATFAALAARVADVFWLNPEPRSDWDTGDSVMSTYAPYCTAVLECRSARQLRDAVATVSRT